MREKKWKKRTVRMSSKLWWEVMKLAKERGTNKARLVRDILRKELNIKEEE